MSLNNIKKYEKWEGYMQSKTAKLISFQIDCLFFARNGWLLIHQTRVIIWWYQTGNIRIECLRKQNKGFYSGAQLRRVPYNIGSLKCLNPELGRENHGHWDDSANKAGSQLSMNVSGVRDLWKLNKESVKENLTSEREGVVAGDLPTAL